MIISDLRPVDRFKNTSTYENNVLESLISIQDYEKFKFENKTCSVLITNSKLIVCLHEDAPDGTHKEVIQFVPFKNVSGYTINRQCGITHQHITVTLYLKSSEAVSLIFPEMKTSLLNSILFPLSKIISEAGK